MKRTLYAAACCVFIVGCGGTAARTGETSQLDGYSPDQRPLGKTLVYECSGYDFIARLGPGEMAVWLEDRYVILSRVRSASGVRYEEGTTVFWSKAGEAWLQLDRHRYADCRLAPRRVPWEDARRRGVDFRAVGNEPGWTLEVQRGRHLLFVGDYGMRRVLLNAPLEEVEGATRSYHAADGDNDLRVEIVDGICTDSMAGDAYPSQVLLHLNGSTLWGCGRSLDHPWK